MTGLHGLKGEVFVHVFSRDVSWINKLKEIVFEDAKGHRHPRLVRSLRPHKEGFLATLEGIDDRNSAELLRAQLVYVSSDLFTTESGDSTFYLAEIEGFKVFDQGQCLGSIIGFSSNSVQDLLVVELPQTQGKVEIPLVEDFLETIDFEKKEVHMILPPGLMDL